MENAAAGFFVVFRHEPGGGDESRRRGPRTARGVEDAPVTRSMTSVKKANDAAGCVELASFVAFGAGEFAEKVFVDTPEGVVVHRCGNFGDFLEQFLEEGAVKRL